MIARFGLVSQRSLSMSSRMGKPDLVTQAFLKQIKDLAAKQKAAGGSLVNTSPEIKKKLDDQLNKLAQKYKLASSDVVSKLDVKFEQAKVESSVQTVLEGKTLDDLIAEVANEEKEYLAERDAKRKEEAKRQAALADAKA
ncbi:unnamed protein product [Bursaphelenchus xylophilus]|uniref:(pine wood nematode) hypothetical protein n=1 Tax=Bursaphelenchus xylophilus TaxID=6326 RepID=A0A1I7S8I5_BURXY|nr:unnamed protein product [Bursaphelenchus xylophilus]CAG9121113.1 unnamed protein product [Bursaphelenchus xylophilus]